MIRNKTGSLIGNEVIFHSPRKTHLILHLPSSFGSYDSFDLNPSIFVKIPGVLRTIQEPHQQDIHTLRPIDPYYLCCPVSESGIFIMFARTWNIGA